jgi:hypothetical protein
VWASKNGNPSRRVYLPKPLGDGSSRQEGQVVETCENMIRSYQGHDEKEEEEEEHLDRRRHTPVHDFLSHANLAHGRRRRLTLSPFHHALHRTGPSLLPHTSSLCSTRVSSLSIKLGD